MKTLAKIRAIQLPTKLAELICLRELKGMFSKQIIVHILALAVRGDL